MPLPFTIVIRRTENYTLRLALTRLPKELVKLIVFWVITKGGYGAPWDTTWEHTDSRDCVSPTLTDDEIIRFRARPRDDPYADKVLAMYPKPRDTIDEVNAFTSISLSGKRARGFVNFSQ